MFVVVIPPRFEHDLRAGRNPAIQVNIDATAMQQAGIGAGYIRNIINDRVHVVPAAHGRDSPSRPSTWSSASCSTPTAMSSWFKSVVAHHQPDHAADRRPDGRRGDPRARARHARAPAGHAADARSRSRWPRCGPTALVILLATAASLLLIVHLALQVPFAGSVALWFVGRRALSVLRDGARHLPGDDLAIDGAVRAADHPGDRRAACCCRAAARPSRASRGGCSTLTYLLPSRHFVSFSQVIIYRGGGLGAVWRQFLMVDRRRPGVLRLQPERCSASRSPSPSELSSWVAARTVPPPAVA